MREYYDTYENKKHDNIGCLEGEIISKIYVDEDDILTITTKSGTDVTLDGSGSSMKIKCFLETSEDELLNLIGEKIIKATEKAVDYNGGDLFFFYDIETFNHTVQLRFVGEDDTYYASHVDIYRTLTDEEKEDRKLYALGVIDKIKKDIEKII